MTAPLTMSALPAQGIKLCCPSCGTARLHVHPQSSEVPGGGYWLNDGDTLFGLHRRRNEAGWAYEDIGFNCMLEVGHCPSCLADYFVVEIMVVGSPVDFERDLAYADTYFFLNRDRGPETNLIISADIPDHSNLVWWASRFETPKGPLLHHCFGPYPDPAGVLGPYGVMACGAGCAEAPSSWRFADNLLFSAWESLVDLARRDHRGVARVERMTERPMGANARADQIQASPSPDTDLVSASPTSPGIPVQPQSVQSGSNASELARRHEQGPHTKPASSESLLSCGSTDPQSCERANQTRSAAILAGWQPPSDSLAAQSRR